MARSALSRSQNLSDAPPGPARSAHWSLQLLLPRAASSTPPRRNVLGSLGHPVNFRLSSPSTHSCKCPAAAVEHQEPLITSPTRSHEIQYRRHSEEDHRRICPDLLEDHKRVSSWHPRNSRPHRRRNNKVSNNGVNGPGLPCRETLLG